MTHHRVPWLLCLLLCVIALPLLAQGRDDPLRILRTPEWKKIAINEQSVFECAGVGDINGDRRLDIVSGDSWYEAPSWKRHVFREVKPFGTYMEDFSNVVSDVNGDGLQDIILSSYFTRKVSWLRHPAKLTDPWVELPVDEPGNIEATAVVDINGDRRPDLLPNSVNVVVWYEWKGGRGTVEWEKHDLGSEGAGHGVGHGDVNRDGRVDIITPRGWYEQPASKEARWTWHPEFDLGATGISILGTDVDGDGRTDVVWGMGHDYGLYWLRQTGGPGADGKRQWERRTIDKSFSEAHVLMPVDLDGNKRPWLVTGKRVYAHEVEPGATDAPCVYAYRYDRAAGRWDKRVLSEGKPAANAPAGVEGRSAQKDFERGSVGTGLEITPADLDRDGDLDLVCPGKTGLYVLQNPGKG